MEVAGLVLGGIPLVLYALDNYHRCLNPAKDYWKYDSTLKIIRMNVFIQQEQLKVTLRNCVGLEKPSQKELQERLLQLYPRAKCQEFLNIILHMEHIVQKLMDTLEIDSMGKVCTPYEEAQFLVMLTTSESRNGPKTHPRELTGNGERSAVVSGGKRGNLVLMSSRAGITP